MAASTRECSDWVMPSHCTCFAYCLFATERQAGKLSGNTNWQARSQDLRWRGGVGVLGKQ